MSDKFKSPKKTIEDVYLFEQNNSRIGSNFKSTHKFTDGISLFPVLHAIILLLSIIVTSVMFRYVSQSKQYRKNNIFLHEMAANGGT